MSHFWDSRSYCGTCCAGPEPHWIINYPMWACLCIIKLDTCCACFSATVNKKRCWHLDFSHFQPEAPVHIRPVNKIEVAHLAWSAPKRTIIKISSKKNCVEATIQDHVCKHCSTTLPDHFNHMCILPLWPIPLTHILSLRFKVSEHELLDHKSKSWQQIEVLDFVTGGQTSEQLMVCLWLTGCIYYLHSSALLKKK